MPFRTLLNFLIDFVSFLILLGWISSSLIVRFVFPPGTLAAGWKLWEYDYNHWCDIQFGWMALFLLLILIHIMLHWNWVCGVITTQIGKRRGRTFHIQEGPRTLLGVGLFILILLGIGLLLAFADSQIQGPSNN